MTAGWLLLALLALGFTGQAAQANPGSNHGHSNLVVSVDARIPCVHRGWSRLVVVRPDLTRYRRCPAKLVVTVFHSPGCQYRPKVEVKPILRKGWRVAPKIMIRMAPVPVYRREYSRRPVPIRPVVMVKPWHPHPVRPVVVVRPWHPRPHRVWPTVPVRH